MLHKYIGINENNVARGIFNESFKILVGNRSKNNHPHQSI